MISEYAWQQLHVDLVSPFPQVCIRIETLQLKSLWWSSSNLLARLSPVSRMFQERVRMGLSARRVFGEYRVPTQQTRIRRVGLMHAKPRDLQLVKSKKVWTTGDGVLRPCTLGAKHPHKDDMLEEQHLANQTYKFTTDAKVVTRARHFEIVSFWEMAGEADVHN
eukprot:5049170-Amphidinium_carterae.1